jgi:hypothetical protein
MDCLEDSSYARKLVSRISAHINRLSKTLETVAVFGYSAVKPALGFAVLVIVTMKRMNEKSELPKVFILEALLGRIYPNTSTLWDGHGANVPMAGSDTRGSSVLRLYRNVLTTVTPKNEGLLRPYRARCPPKSLIRSLVLRGIRNHRPQPNGRIARFHRTSSRSLFLPLRLRNCRIFYPLSPALR